MKIRNKVALLLLLASTVILVSLVLFVYIFVSRDSTISFDEQLSYRIHSLQRTLSDAQYKDKYLQTEKLPMEKSSITNTLEDSALFVAQKWPLQFRKTMHNQGHAYWEKQDTMFLGELYHWSGQDYTIVVGALDIYKKEYMVNLEKVLFIGLGIAIIFIMMMAIIFSRKIFIPVHTITQEMQKIGSGNLHLRLPVLESKDEMAELTETFNEMLDRMETAFEAQKNFVSHASHEFNTPLTTIIGETQFALGKDRDTTQYKEALEIILKEAERLRDLTQNLLRLAQTQYVNQELQMVPIRVDEMLWDIKRTQEKIYPNSKISFPGDELPSEEDKISVMGNVQLLHLAISNIVLNASKYSHFKPVNIQLVTLGRSVEIIIQDKGVGIPKEDLDKIFEPYFRASNTHSFSGFGIGLPLTANIIRMHKGEISIESTIGQGTEVIIQLPSLKYFNG